MNYANGQDACFVNKSLALVSIQDSECTSIEERTRNQSKNKFWFEQRAYRITASNFGQFCKMSETTDRVKSFIQSRQFFTSASVRHGLLYEDIAFAEYS